MDLRLTFVDSTASPPASRDVRVLAGATVSFEELRTSPAVAPLAAAVGRWFAGGTELRDDDTVGRPPLLHGAVLSPHPPLAGPPPSAAPLLELRVVSGPDAGTVVALAPGRHTVGRGAGCDVQVLDPTVSRLHAVVEVSTRGATVRAMDGAGGATAAGADLRDTPVPLSTGAVVRLGDSTLTVGAADAVPTSVRPDGTGRLGVNRPPRAVPADRPLTVALPTRPERRPGPRLPLLAILLPLVLGLMLAVLMTPIYALFVLLSPIMLIGNHLSDRRSGIVGHRAALVGFEQEEAAAREHATAAVAVEEARRREESPDAAALTVIACRPTPRLWERRRHDPDVLSVRLGTADMPSSVSLGVAGGDQVALTAHAVPVTVSLLSVGVLGVCGDRAHVSALVRHVLGQLATLHSPRDVDVVVLAADGGRAADWAWAGWLPHCTTAGSSEALVAWDLGAATRRVAELLLQLETRASTRLSGRAWTGGRTVVLLDGARLLRQVPGVARLLEEGPEVGIHAVCVDDDSADLPVECGATATVRRGDPSRGVRLAVTLTASAGLGGGVTGRGQRVAPGAFPAVAGDGDVVPDLTGLPWIERLARALAPLYDATPSGATAALPDTARLLPLGGGPCADPSGPGDTAGRWADADDGAVAVLGVAPGPTPLTIDLAADGPHALVAGTTGSGKSELLQTLVASLALAYPPDSVTFVLVDFKGGSAFRDCARLPHTLGMVTDLDGHLAARALESLGAELRRRERVLRDHGVSDLDGFRALAPSTSQDRPALARLVLVVDEFATLAEELPDFVGGLVGIAQRGRSLGIHLVLATQRPGGVVSADIRANTAIRIALRVTDTGDSHDIIDAPDAAGISPARPGRAYLRTGAGPLQILQAAHVGARARMSGGDLEIRPDPVASWGDRDRGGDRGRNRDRGRDRGRGVASDGDGDRGEGTPGGATDLARIVDSCRRAAVETNAVAPPSPWLAPLPDTVALHDLAGPTTGSCLAVGIQDRPADQSQPVWTLDLDSGDHLLIAGGPRSGRTTALRSITAAVGLACDPSSAHVYVIDPTGALSGLEGLAHCGAVVGRDQRSRGDRLLTRLAAEVDRRLSLTVAADADGHAPGAGTDLQAAGTGTDGQVVGAGTGPQAAGTDGPTAGTRTSAATTRTDRHPAGTGAPSAPVHGLPRMLLLVDGWESFQADYDVLDHGRPVETLLRLLRDGAAVGLTVVVTGDRSVLTGRLASLARGRLLLRFADRSDFALAGIPARQVPDHLPPGRALLPDATAVQVAILGGDPEPAAQAAAVRRLAARHRSTPAPGPLRVRVLPRSVSIDALHVDIHPPGTVVVGVGGDDAEAVTVDLSAGAFTVAGGPGTGRSTTLRTVAHGVLRGGSEVALLTPRHSVLADLSGYPGVHGPFRVTDVEAVRELLQTDRSLVVLCDDVESVSDSPMEALLASLSRSCGDTSAGRPDGGGQYGADGPPSVPSAGVPARALVVAGGTAELGAAYRGLLVEVRRSRRGLLLAPTGGLDSDLFGVRVGRLADAPVGRGVLVSGGRTTTVQVAL